MFENIGNFFKKIFKAEKKESDSGKEAKERLHLVLMQDRANVSADFLDMMKQEIIEVIKKYIDVDENAIDVRLTNQQNGDGTTGAPALYANIPIINVKEDMKVEKIKSDKKEDIINEKQGKHEEIKEESIDVNKIDEKSDDNEDEKEDNTEEVGEIKISSENEQTEQSKEK